MLRVADSSFLMIACMSVVLACAVAPPEQETAEPIGAGGYEGSPADAGAAGTKPADAAAGDSLLPSDASSCTACAAPACRDGACPEPKCGDGFVNRPEEQCDGDGAGTGGFTRQCDDDCTWSACGDGILNVLAGEACDDGNADNADDCPDGPAGTCQPASCVDGLLHQRQTGQEMDIDCGGATCRACPGVLLLSEIAVTPTAGEFVELYNASDDEVSLSLVHIADYSSYYVFDGSKPKASDFRIHFPPEAFIGARDFLVISLRSASEFASIYGFYPDFDLAAADPNAPAMLGQYTASSGLTNSEEMIVAFAYHPSAVLVRDIDYLIYGPASERVDKSDVSLLGQSYAADTAAALQDPIAAPSTNGQAASRCDESEGSELKSNGNGYAGHDETNENMSRTWQVTEPTPKAPNACR